MVVADSSPRLYSERLTPSPLAWLIAPGVGLVFFIMFLPVSAGVAAGIGAVLGAVSAFWLWRQAALVEVTATHLSVGRARIEVDSLGEVEVCTPARMSERMGPGSDARSYVLTRPWVHGGLYVEQTDPRDPTPYWLFSSRHPEELSRAISQARS